jgi:hypothetical protein
LFVLPWHPRTHVRTAGYLRAGINALSLQALKAIHPVGRANETSLESFARKGSDKARSENRRNISPFPAGPFLPLRIDSLKIVGSSLTGCQYPLPPRLIFASINPGATGLREKAEVMLNHIPWSLFGLYVLGACGLYYACFLLRYYRWEILRFLTRKGKKNQPQEETRDGRQLEIEFEEVMGKPRASPGVTFQAAHEVRFQPADPSPETAPSPNLVPEVLQEFRDICGILETERGTPEDLAFLLEEVRHKFPELSQSPHLPTLLENLREQLPFAVSSQELGELWHSVS